MKPSYRTPFEGLILRDGRTKGSNPPLRYFWHRWTRSETAPPPVFTSASHPLAVAFLSRAGLPDAAGPIGYCMLPGRRKAKRTHEWRRDLAADIASINQDRLCLVTLCTDEELARDSPDFQARIASEFACREHLPITDKRRPHDTRAFDELIARLVARIENGWRVVVQRGQGPQRPRGGGGADRPQGALRQGRGRCEGRATGEPEESPPALVFVDVRPALE